MKIVKDSLNLLQFLVYINELNYTMGHLDSTIYRLVIFKVQDFLKYQNPTAKSTSYYQLKKGIDFYPETSKELNYTIFFRSRIPLFNDYSRS